MNTPRCHVPVILAVIAALAGANARAQQPVPVSRADAVAATLASGARLALARADTAAAAAQLMSARMLQNPLLAATYSKSTPNYHYTLEVPLDFLTQRGPRVGSARAARQSVQHHFAFELASSALDADTTYTRALAARDRLALSRRNAQDADSLRRLAVTRRDAGDASDLDVELATISAGQAANAAAADSLSYLSVVLDLQTVMGLSADRVTLQLTDSLAAPGALAPADSALSADASPLQIAAAASAMESARLATSAQRRGFFGVPSLVAGVETGDPTGAEPGMLPTFGIALPLPLFNFNRGPVRQAQAEQARATAAYSLIRAQVNADIARTRREASIAQLRVEGDRTLVASAARVASMSLTAYREGAVSLPNVLEAQRSARDVQAQYVDDLATLLIAAAELRVLTLTPTSARAP